MKTSQQITEKSEPVLPVVMLQYKINLSYLQEFILSWCLGACYFSHPPGTPNVLQVSCFGSPLLQCQVPSVPFYNEQNVTRIQIRYFPCSPCSLENNYMVPKQIGRQMAPEHSLGNIGPETLWAISAVRLQQMSQPLSCSAPQAWLAPALSLCYLQGSNKPVQQLHRWQ